LNNTLTVAGVTTLTNLTGTGNRVVTANASGVLSATFSIPTNGYIENQTATAQNGGFNINGSGTVGGTLTAAANVAAGANLSVGAFSRFGNNIGVGLSSLTAPLTERVTVSGNVVPQFDTGGELGQPTRRWNNLYTYGVNSAGDLLPSVDANGAGVGFNLGSSGARWNTVFAFNGTIQPSDARLKTNVTNLGYGLSTVMALRPVRYAWKTTPNAANKIGFIAQELQQLVPEVVNVGTDANHTLGVNYAELVPVLVKALQEQQQQLDTMRGRAEKAEAAVLTFEQRLRALEAGTPVNATAQGQR